MQRRSSEGPEWYIRHGCFPGVHAGQERPLRELLTATRPSILASGRNSSESFGTATAAMRSAALPLRSPGPDCNCAATRNVHSPGKESRWKERCWLFGTARRWRFIDRPGKSFGFRRGKPRPAATRCSPLERTGRMRSGCSPGQEDHSAPLAGSGSRRPVCTGATRHSDQRHGWPAIRPGCCRQSASGASAPPRCAAG